MPKYSNPCAVIDDRGYVLAVADYDELIPPSPPADFPEDLLENKEYMDRFYPSTNKFGRDLEYYRDVIPLRNTDPEEILGMQVRGSRARIEFMRAPITFRLENELVTYYIAEPFVSRIIEEPLYKEGAA